MKIKINNEVRELAECISLASLLSDMPMEGTATALNGQFVPKEARVSTILQDGDEVTIISAAYGG